MWIKFIFDCFQKKGVFLAREVKGFLSEEIKCNCFLRNWYILLEMGYEKSFPPEDSHGWVNLNDAQDSL